MSYELCDMSYEPGHIVLAFFDPITFSIILISYFILFTYHLILALFINY